MPQSAYKLVYLVIISSVSFSVYHIIEQRPIILRHMSWHPDPKRCLVFNLANHCTCKWLLHRLMTHALEYASLAPLSIMYILGIQEVAIFMPYN